MNRTRLALERVGESGELELRPREGQLKLASQLADSRAGFAKNLSHFQDWDIPSCELWPCTSNIMINPCKWSFRRRALSARSSLGRLWLIAIGLTLACGLAADTPRDDASARVLATIKTGHPEEALAILANEDSFTRDQPHGLRALALLRCGRFLEAEAELARSEAVAHSLAGSLTRAEIALGRGHAVEALAAAAECSEAEGFRGDAALLSAFASLDAERYEAVDEFMSAALPHLGHMPEFIRDATSQALSLLSGFAPEQRMRVARQSSGAVLPIALGSDTEPGSTRDPNS